MLGEHVTRAHAGTRHVSHGEHAPLAYSVSRSLSQSVTPALPSSPSLSPSCYTFPSSYLLFHLLFFFISIKSGSSTHRPHFLQFHIFYSFYFATLSLFFILFVLSYFFLAAVISFAFLISCLTIYIILFLFIIVIFLPSLFFSVSRSFLRMFC